MHLYYRGGVSDEVLQTEQHRIEEEQAQANSWIQSAAHESKDAAGALDEALAIINNCHANYLAATPLAGPRFSVHRV